MKNPCDNCERECRGYNYGCKIWREWWIKNWNDNISTAPKEMQGRQFFRYEHPDLVREGKA